MSQFDVSTSIIKELERKWRLTAYHDKTYLHHTMKKIGKYDLLAKTKHSAMMFNSIEIRNSAGIK
ncbi:hypothetical protein [Methanobrevibacter sp.]|uniref:hypothetical protein n=1 Tax=Methanobrevibacter sp. TaxID=66852 RepID=UPI002E770C4F|nr:hypothetical protein [Methanobrevibacter sp.]MEE0938196.1 hypothetical protein [Methanobrevibacter sp.]